jgi:crossover junction endodeoxyribonuclease RusA
MICFILDWPPTINTYYSVVNNRKILSKKGRDYKKNMVKSLMVKKPPKGLTGRIELRIDAHPPDRRKRDLDNLVKPIQDSLQDYGMFDDSQIDYLRVRRCEVEKGGRVIVRVFER